MNIVHLIEHLTPVKPGCLDRTCSRSRALQADNESSGTRQESARVPVRAQRAVARDSGKGVRQGPSAHRRSKPEAPLEPSGPKDRSSRAAEVRARFQGATAPAESRRKKHQDRLVERRGKVHRPAVVHTTQSHSDRAAISLERSSVGQGAGEARRTLGHCPRLVVISRMPRVVRLAGRPKKQSAGVPLADGFRQSAKFSPTTAGFSPPLMCTHTAACPVRNGKRLLYAAAHLRSEDRAEGGTLTQAFGGSRTRAHLVHRGKDRKAMRCRLRWALSGFHSEQ